MKTPQSASRLGLSVLLPVGLLLGLTGCSGSDPVPGAQPAGEGEVQFTSDTGSVTINVPDDWEEATGEAREFVGGYGSNGGVIELAFDLDGPPFMGGSSIVIMSMASEGVPTDEIVDQVFEALSALFAGEASYPGDVTTVTGLTLSRMDLSYDISGTRLEQMYLIAVVDDTVIQVVATLGGPGLDDENEVLEALETFAIR